VSGTFVMCQGESARPLQSGRGMTRLTAIATFFLLLLCASPVAAQRFEDSAGVLAAPLQLDSGDTLAAATSQHRVGSALLATGLTAHIVGLGASFYSFIAAMTRSFDGSCVGGCGTSDGPDWSAVLATSLATSGVGLVLFFIGLGLDIHAHVLRGHASGLALTPNGLSLSF